jgi:enoyl-CoA hydratase
MTYETLALSIDGGIAHIELDRPDRANAMNRPFWDEMVRVFGEIDADPTIRCVVISGRGRHFCSGLDLQDFAGLFQTAEDTDPGRQREQMRRTVLQMQESFSVIERCRVPVLAAVHGACIGGGVDLISACDCRYASSDAFISIQEINIGVTADVGTLQRLPHLMPQGVVRELTFTGERMGTERARQFGLWNDVSETREAMMARVMDIARTIASKAPLAMTGSKEMLNYTRDHTVADGLNYVATWNAAMLLSSDVQRAMMASKTKSEAQFDDLYPDSGMLKQAAKSNAA